MIKPGLCSVCFKQQTPEYVISLAAKAKLSGIEWIGNTHVPADDISNAKRIGNLTRVAGLEVSSYGSVFRLGTESDFLPHLEAAKALGATMIRVFTKGGKASFEFTPEERFALAKEAKEISRKAAQYGISVACECHDLSITDCVESQLLFLNEVDDDNFGTYWQEILALQPECHMPSLQSVYRSGKLSNLHIYQYAITSDTRERKPLSDGFEKWQERFSLFADDKTPRYALLEYVGGYTEEDFLDDAATLLKLTNLK